MRWRWSLGPSRSFPLGETLVRQDQVSPKVFEAGPCTADSGYMGFIDADSTLASRSPQAEFARSLILASTSPPDPARLWRLPQRVPHPAEVQRAHLMGCSRVRELALKLEV